MSDPQKPNVEDDYSHLPVKNTDVFIAGSGPIGATFCRKILEEHPAAKVCMAEIGSQDNPVIGAHHKNSIKYQKDIDAFVNVIKGALQPISVPPQDNFMPTLGEVAWTNGPGKPLIQSYHNPNQLAEKNLTSYMTRTVGGMATHWTCACPLPHEEEMKNCPIDKDEFKTLLKEAQVLLNVNPNEFDISIRHNLVKDTLIKHFQDKKESRDVANLPLAVKRNADNPEFVTWSGVDTVLGKWATEKDPRFTLLTETRVTKLIRDKVPGSKKIVGALCRDLKTHKDFVVRAQQYVVACGAVGTPQVLYNSKIRPEPLGKYLTEQSLSFCQIVLKRTLIDSLADTEPAKKHLKKHEEDSIPIPFNDPEPQVTLRYSSDKQYHVQIHRDAFSYGDVGPRADPRTVVDLRFFGRQDISKENCITFADPITTQDKAGASVLHQDGTTDGYGMPQATFHVSRSPADAKRDHQMMEDMCDVANALGAYLPGSLPQFMEPGLVLHITGTTRVGSDPKDSVADKNCKVWDFDNLYVGGNNVIPDSTACNPTLTSVAYAIKAARNINKNLHVAGCDMPCCIVPGALGPFTPIKPTPAEATRAQAWCTDSSFTEVNVKLGLGDGYWILDFPFRNKVDKDEGPVGPELLGSGLGYKQGEELVRSELRMYRNPYGDIQNHIKPQDEWEHTVVKTVDYAVSAVYGNFRPKTGLNDIILCHNYGPSMDDLNMEGGTVSYLINPGDKTQGDWEMRDIGQSPSMHRLLTGHFSQKQHVEVMGFPVISKSSDRDTATPILLYKPTAWDGPNNDVPCQWETMEPLQGLSATSRLIHDVHAVHSKNGGLDTVLVAGREGVSLLWYEALTQTWRWENIGTGIPQTRKPFENPYWGSGSVATGRVGNDSVGYIASCEAFHGNLVSVYVKPPGTRADNVVSSEHWRRFVIDDFGDLKPGEWTGTIHNVKCADLDGSGVDSIIVACMGYPEGKAANMGTYVYRPIDLQRGQFARYKISNASAARIAVADYRCSGTWDVATISYSVPNYLETANPAMRIMLNNVPQTRRTIKMQRLGDEAMIRVPRANTADHTSELPFLDIAGKKLSIVVLPPCKEYVLGQAFRYMGHDYAADGVKVINGELSWTGADGTITRGIAVPAHQAKTMIPESHIIKAGPNGAIFVRLASSKQTSMPGLKVDDMDDIATINITPPHVDSDVRDMTFPWVKVEDREWAEGGFKWPFYNLVGFHVVYDDDTLTNFCHIQAWTLGIGETAAFHNHDKKSFCEIHACISNGTGRGGMWWAKNKEGDDHFHHHPTEMDKDILAQYADSVVVNDMEEHGPLWRMNGDLPALRPNDTVDYPYHAWLAGRKEADSPDQVFDVWLAFEFPSSEFQKDVSRFNGCAACGCGK